MKHHPSWRCATSKRLKGFAPSKWRNSWMFSGLLLICVFVTSGATCARRRGMAEYKPPVVFEKTPTIREIAQQLDRTLAITRLESPSITISSAELITKLQGNMAWQSPSSFRLQAYPGTRLMGNALDAGSNAEVFWLQTQLPPPPTLYFARHEEFESQIGPRKILPVSPLWLKEAFGIISLDPNLLHEGPIVRADGKLQVQTWLPTPRGNYRRILVIEPNQCIVVQTLLYDYKEKLVAAANQSDHKYDESTQVSLPRVIQIELQPDEGPVIAFTVEINTNYSINQVNGIDEQRFAMPDTSGISVVNLTQVPSSIAALPAVRPSYSAEPVGGRIMSSPRAILR